MYSTQVPRVVPDATAIRERREAVLLTQAQVASRLRIDAGLFSKMLKGTRPMDLVTCVRLAEVLGCEWTELVAPDPVKAVAA